jgi:hypothetical protein
MAGNAVHLNIVTQLEKTMSDLMLDVGQANELKMAFRRAGATPEEVKKMGEGNFMHLAVALLRGTHDLVSRDVIARLRARDCYKHDGVWYATVTSNGWLGSQWFSWFVKQEIFIPLDVHDFLLSPNFKPTEGVTTKLAIVSGKYYPGGVSHDTCPDMEREIDRLKLAPVNPEVACLLCMAFSIGEFQDVGFEHWFVMHAPMRSDVDGGPARLMVTDPQASKNYGLSLRTARGNLAGWNDEAGYVYACDPLV